MKNKDYPLYETTLFDDFREMVENVADRHPDHYALSYRVRPTDEEAVRLTYDQCRREMRDYGTGLISMGLRNKTCAVIGECSVGWVYTYFALGAIGAVSVPLDKEWKEEDLAATLQKAHCCVVFYSASLSKKLPYLKEHCPEMQFISIWGKPDGEDLTRDAIQEKGHALYEAGDHGYYEYEIDRERMSTIVFTSGTTGKGKGVMLSQKNICSDMYNGMYLFDISRKSMMVLPPHHTFGSTTNLVGHYAQGCEVYITSGLRYIAQEMKQEQPVHMVLVPLFVESLYKKIWNTAEKNGQAKLLRRMMKLSNGIRRLGLDARRKMFASILNMFGGRLNLIICGGAALNQDIIDTFDAIGITILNGYGITECSPLISCNRNRWQKSGSVGLPILHSQVKIADANENGDGEICFKGDNVMLGYFEDPEATAAVMDEEGFFHTGDLGHLDEDGWIYITGRRKNLIILSNGKNVYPEELENEISGIFGVSEVVVYAGESKNRTDKEVIVAEIFPDADALAMRNIEDVQSYFSEEIRKINAREPGYKQIGHIKIRKTEFIKNTSKKITRFNIDKSIDNDEAK